MMPDNQNPQQARGSDRFLSLKWKVMLLLSMTLLGVNGTLSWLAYNDQITRFEQQRSVIRDRHLAQARSLQKESAQRMQQVADMMASAAGMAGFSTAEPELRKFTDMFDTYWVSLQLNLGMDVLGLYDADGELLFEWNSGYAKGAQEIYQVNKVLKHEQSAAWLECTQECTQFAAAPILAQGRVAGVAVVAGSLADMIGSFRRLTGVDVGLLSPTPDAAYGYALPRLGRSVVGISGMQQNIGLLRSLSELPVEKNGVRWIKLQQGDRQFELAFTPVGEENQDNRTPILVVIEDVSQGYAHIRTQALRWMGGQVATFLLALVLLAILLGAPLRRMTRAAETIPLLGQRAFAEVRNRIRLRSGYILKDEVDHLDQAAVALSQRLEDLEMEVQNNADQMQEMLNKIAIERDFNESLLDTAQVIILTQNGEGEISTINHYGEVLTGWHEEELKGKRFFEVACPVRPGEQHVAQMLRDVAEGRQEQLLQECALVHRDGTEREIVWSHTRLTGMAGQLLSVGMDITERKRAETRMVWLAEHDQLTGLANRQYFQRELEQTLAMVRRTGRSGALLYLDLDGFKYVNDISGHQAGDALLRMVGEEMSAIIRDVDLLARLGGDELGILLHECDQAGAVEVAEKINRRLAEMKFPGLGAAFHVSASIGIVMFPTEDMDAKQVLASADIAMYQAKSADRGRWHMYAPGERMQEKLQRWVHWEERLKNALKDNRFVLHYQPILDIHSGRISHFEALVRMRGESGELIPPGEFMEVAEKSGLIRDLDRYVVHTVIGRLLELLAAGQSYKLAVNLSGVSINDSGLLDFLRQELARNPALPQHLIFEITETAAVSDFASAKNFMQSVRELGGVFALDDFGVGFSSFYYVKHLPVDYIKIDGSFIRSLADSPDDQVFARAIAEVARGFGKKTVAEFVGDERVLDLLREYGVDYAQGYLIGKPEEDIPGQ